MKKDRTPRKNAQELRSEITPAPEPRPHFATQILNATLANGVTGIRQAQRAALRASKAFAVEIEDYWRRPTSYLTAIIESEGSDPNARASARFALAWRPKFLAALSLTMSPLLASRASRIHADTAYTHRKSDPDFARHWQEAHDDAVELLHARAFQRSVEGDTEAIYYMGVPVGYVRKFDSRLQIEMLRAHRPDKFKTAGVQVNLATKGDVFVLTEEQRHELQRINRAVLEATPLPALPGQTETGSDQQADAQSARNSQG